MNVWLPHKKYSPGGEQGDPWKKVLIIIIGAPQWNQRKSEIPDGQYLQHGEEVPTPEGKL